MTLNTALGDDSVEALDLRMISEALNTFLRAWDNAVVATEGRSEATSTVSGDLYLGEHDLGWTRAMREQSRTVMFMVTASVLQMTRSVSALFDVHDRYSLTFGHIPLARSIFEGVGQVQWLTADDEDLAPGPKPVLSKLETIERCRRRTARALLTVKANWSQCLRDARYQNETAMEAEALARLEELSSLAKEIEAPTVDKDGNWSILGIRRPSTVEFGKRGWELAWWPEKTDWHPYGYVSAISHHNLYPIAGTLTPAVSDGSDVLRIGPSSGDVFAGGLWVTYAFSRLIELVFTYLGWDLSELISIRPLVERAHRALNIATSQ